MHKKQIIGSILLTITALVWGGAFVSQRAGMEFVGPCTFNAARILAGGFALLIPILIFKIQKGPNRRMNKWEERKHLFIAGITCGVILAIASILQQTGIQYTTASKAAFITTLYIVIVPVISFFLKKPVSRWIWTGVVLAATGLYFLCINDNLSVEKGDTLVALSALAYSLHILAIGYFAPKVDCVKMSCVQFFTAGLLNAIPMFIYENPNLAGLFEARYAIFYAGVISCGIGFTLQVIGQKNVNPTIASLIMSLESVFALICAMLILNENLVHREILGCALMFFAVLTAQIPSKKKFI